MRGVLGRISVTKNPPGMEMNMCGGMVVWSRGGYRFRKLVPGADAEIRLFETGQKLAANLADVLERDI